MLSRGGPLCRAPPLQLVGFCLPLCRYKLASQSQIVLIEIIYGQWRRQDAHRATWVEEV